MHRAGSITWSRFDWPVIAFVGHFCAQMVQPTQLVSIRYAITSTDSRDTKLLVQRTREAQLLEQKTQRHVLQECLGLRLNSHPLPMQRARPSLRACPQTQ